MSDEFDSGNAARTKRRKAAKAILATKQELSALAQEHDLTQMQAAYVEGRATGMDPADSAHAAGYADPTYRALRLETHPDINAALIAEREKNAKFIGFSRREVLEGISEAIEQAKTLADPMAQIAGWREVAKICGYYAPEVKKIELTHAHKRKLNELEQMSDEELLELTLKPALEAEFSVVPPQNG